MTNKPTNPERCENCEKPIGKLETPQIWNGTVVCWDCHEKLVAQQNEKESAERAAALANYEKTARKELREEMAYATAPALAEASSRVAARGAGATGHLDSQYKVIVVTTKNPECCKTSPSLNQEIENACNQMASQGYRLVVAYPEAVAVTQCCSTQGRHGSMLIFGRD